MEWMQEMRYIAATGALGAGVDRDSLFAALDEDPRFIAADAGTTDAGAFALGAGETAFSRAAVKRDLSVMLQAGLRARVPVIVGSAGTAGADVHVDWVVEIVEEIARELGEQLRGFAIYAEQDQASLASSLHAGRIRPLAYARELGGEQLARCRHVVAMMGVEPLQQALSTDPQFVIAGRCSDAALYAAVPLMHGFPPGPAWHAGKVVECGTMACETMGAGVMVVTLREDSFSVRPFGPGLRCTPQSVAAHSLYETANPFLFAEPSGTLDISASFYEQEDDHAVRVSGSRFARADEYSVKLEGAELIGFETMLVGGVRDPLILSQLDWWLERIRRYIKGSIGGLMGIDLDGERYRLGFQVYGRDAVMGELEPFSAPGHEVGIVCTTLAPTQAEATEMARVCRQPLLHAPIPEWKGAITGFAYLHNPAWVEVGPAYRFCLNHVLLPRAGEVVHRLRPVELGALTGRVSGLTEVAP
jgi:Acyclic terpene utilisation family protein AtuA